MDLVAETVDVADKERDARRETSEEHGATDEEIEDFIEGFNQPTYRGMWINGQRVATWSSRDGWSGGITGQMRGGYSEPLWRPIERYYSSAVGALPLQVQAGDFLHSVGLMRIVRQEPMLSVGSSLAGAPPAEGPKSVPPSGSLTRVDCHPLHTAKTGCPLLSKNLTTGQMTTVLYSAVGVGSVSNVAPITFSFPASTVADDEFVSAPSIYILPIRLEQVGLR
jgi:hypothetical protein